MSEPRSSPFSRADTVASWIHNCHHIQLLLEPPLATTSGVNSLLILLPTCELLRTPENIARLHCAVDGQTQCTIQSCRHNHTEVVTRHQETHWEVVLVLALICDDVVFDWIWVEWDESEWDEGECVVACFLVRLWGWREIEKWSLICLCLRWKWMEFY